MAKYFTYFHLNRGLSPAMRHQIKIEKRNGLKPLVLKSTVISISKTRVVKHLHEERYQPWLDRIEGLLEREGIPVYDVSAPSVVDTTKPTPAKAAETAVPSKEEVTENIETPTAEEVTENTEPHTEEAKVFLDTRPRRAADAPIVVYLSQSADTLQALVDILDKNDVYVPHNTPVSDIPEILEVYVKRGLPENPEGLRGAVTDDLSILHLGLRYAFPVVWLGDALPAHYDGLYTTELNANFLKLSVGSAEARKAALEN